MLSVYDNPLLQKAVSTSYHGFLSRTHGNYAYKNAELCRVHSDWHWNPSDYVLWAKVQQWPSKDRSSGLAVLRVKEPPSAGAITAEKWAVMSGAKQEAARQIAHKAKEVFQLCLEAGISCQEMQTLPE